MATGKPLTLRQMVGNTPRGWVDNAKDTRIVSARSVWLEGKTRRRIEAIAQTDVTTGKKHLLFLECMDGPKISAPHARVKVSCDCGAFMYTFEAALHHHGNADIVHSNGAFPQYTNPRLVGGLCKHLVKVALYALKKGM